MLTQRREDRAGDQRRGSDQVLAQALAAAGSCAYRWLISSDEINWSENAPGVLGVAAPGAIATGRAFAGLLDPGNVTSRFETVMRSASRDMGEGVAFRVEYLLRPKGRQAAEAILVEDHGRWYAGPDGRPAEVHGVLRRIDERQKREQSLRYLGNFDPLTGMMNRGRFTEALSEAIAAAKAKSKPCGLLLVSLANLDSINQAYGYETSEEIISGMARRLRHALRQGDTIGRFSGSKFAVLLAGCSEADLESVAERFLAVARDAMIDTLRGPVWAVLAIGALSLPAHGKNPAEALAHAEEALNEARRSHSDRAVLFRPDPQRESARRQCPRRRRYRQQPEGQ